MLAKPFTGLVRSIVRSVALFFLIATGSAVATITSVVPGTALTPIVDNSSVGFTYTESASSPADASPQAYFCTALSSPTYQAGGPFVTSGLAIPIATFCSGTATASTGNGPLNIFTSGNISETLTMTPATFANLVSAVGLYGTVYFVRAWTDYGSAQTYTVSRLQLRRVLVANADTLTVIGGNAANVLANDAVGGAAATTANAVVSIISNGGLTGLSVVTGQLLVPTTASAGVYSVNYSLCDAAPGGAANCVSATATLTVTAAANPQSDAATVPSTATTPVTVLANDTIGSAPATTANAIITLVAPLAIPGATVNAAGQIVIPPTAPGPYTLNYRLCNAAVPTNCNQTTLSLTVTAPTLVANADAAQFSPVGGTVPVLANDTIDGVPATAGNVITSITNNGGLAGLTVNPAGAIVVPANPVGVYVATYRICAVVAPTTCTTNTATVTLWPVLVANNDSATLSASGGTVAVLSNDTVDGAPATSANVVTSVVSSGGLTGVTTNAAGALVVPPFAAGTYNVTYRICAVAANTDCTTGVASITVMPSIAANNDTASLPTSGGTVVVLTNDTVGGVAATSSNVTVSVVTTGGLTGVMANASGLLVVPAFAAGVYAVTYQICAVASPTTCANAVATITLTPTLVANNDSATLTTAGGIVAVLANDTVDGVAASTSTNVTIGIVANGGLTGLSTNAAGAVVVPAFAAGTYAATYRICSIAVPATCTNAVVTITLVPTVVANNDSASVSTAGGTVAVLVNDTVDAAAATSGNVTLSIVSNGGLMGLARNASGALVVPPFTAGTYAATYRICSIAAPTVCANATATITLAPVLVLVNDSANLPPSGGAVNVLANDTINGAPATTSNVIVSIVNNGGISGLTVNAAGALAVPPSAPATYAVIYRVCDILNPTRCADANATITVSAPGVVANADAATFPITGGIVNILANDTIELAPATSVNGTVTLVSNGGLTGLAVNASGQLVVPAFAAGTYAATYRLCAVISPATCANAVVAITLTTTLVALPDSYSISSTGGVLSVLANDRIDGAQATAANVTVSIVSFGGLGGLSVNAAGAIVVPASNSGNYTINYRICSIATPANCATASVNIAIVTAIAANADSATLPNIGGDVDVLGNDLVGGVPATTANVSLTIVTTGGLTGLSVTPQGRIRVPASPPGVYTIGYRICSITAPATCASSTATISVDAPVVVATADSATLPSAGGRINILDNDTVNGAPATTSNVAVTVTTTGGLTGLAVDAAGGLVVPAAAPGTYAVAYRICSLGTTTACANAPVTVNIQPPMLVVLPDKFTLPDSGGVLNVLANDTVAGQPASVANAIVSLLTTASQLAGRKAGVSGISGVAVNGDGAIVVPPVAAGDYSIGYRVCARLAPATCADSDVALKVSATAVTLKLVDDIVIATQFGTSFNLLANDTAGGKPVLASASILSLVNNGGLSALSLAASGVLTVPPTSAGVYIATYRVCQKDVPANCADAKARVTVTQSQGAIESTRRHPPSVPGAPTSTYTLTPGARSPVIFSQAIPSTAGAANSPLILGETRLGYGLLSANGRYQSYRRDSDFEPFGALFQYSGTGTLNYRWEVIRPGEPVPTTLDLLPEPSLSLPDRLRQTRYTEVARGQVFLPAMGRYFMRGPDPALLPRTSDGPYLILLRIEANTASVSGDLNGATAFPIQPLTYIVVGERGVVTSDPLDPLDPLHPFDPNDPNAAAAAAERRRLSGGSNVAAFSNMGQLPDAGPGLSSGALRYRPVGEEWKTLRAKPVEIVGSQTLIGKPISLSWKPVAEATVYRVTVEPANDGGALGVDSQQIIGIVKSGGETSYVVKASVLEALGAAVSLRWRVLAYNGEGKLVADSDWTFLKR